MSRKRDQRDTIRAAEAAGLTVTLSGRGHLRCTGPGVLVILPSKYTTNRARLNANATLARAIAGRPNGTTTTRSTTQKDD